MPTRRMIDPAFWQSETMASLPITQRYLFIGLFSNANDQGRLKAHPALIRSTVFPYEDVSQDDLKTDLAALESIDSIHLYSVEGKAYLQIVNWWKYQSPQWAYPSSIPAPDGWHDRLRYRHDNEVLKDNWDGALPNDLGKALPNATGGTDTQGDGWPHRVRVSTSVSDSTSDSEDQEAAIAAAPAAPPPPRNRDEWIGWLEKTTNAPHLVLRMVEHLYPGLDPPTHGKIGSIAKRMGTGSNGYRRLMGLLWDYNGKRIDGDLLPYLLRVHQGKERDNGQGTAAAGDTAEARRAYVTGEYADLIQYGEEEEE